MSAALAHRGPDDEGLDNDGPLCLGHRRLAIIDPRGGRQPMANEEGSVRLLFNGAIYNAPQLRDDLIRRGHEFRTRSDTEVIVHAYEALGLAAVRRLFAAARKLAPGHRAVVADGRLTVQAFECDVPEPGAPLHERAALAELETHLLDAHVDGRADQSRALFALLTFGAWHEQHVERRADDRQ
jgi:hypothetical protein